jgi:hypothetical protein
MVRACSLSGEFDALSDAQVQGFLDEAALHYGTLDRRCKRPAVRDKIHALHAAHRLHQAKKLEAGEDAGDQPGDVKSASLDRIGSWTFGSPALDQQQAKEQVPLDDWASSPYGRRWHGLYKGLAPGTTNTGQAPTP